MPFTVHCSARIICRGYLPIRYSYSRIEFSAALLAWLVSSPHSSQQLAEHTAHRDFRKMDVASTG